MGLTSSILASFDCSCSCCARLGVRLPKSLLRLNFVANCERFFSCPKSDERRRSLLLPLGVVLIQSELRRNIPSGVRGLSSDGDCRGLESGSGLRLPVCSTRLCNNDNREWLRNFNIELYIYIWLRAVRRYTLAYTVYIYRWNFFEYYAGFCRDVWAQWLEIIPLWSFKFVSTRVAATFIPPELILLATCSTYGQQAGACIKVSLICVDYF